MSRFDEPKILEIPHPTNRVWPGTPNCLMPSIEEAFADGVLTGYTWPKHWEHMPGGPVIYGRRKDLSALAKHQQRVHYAWMEGWDIGFLKQYPSVMWRPGWYRPFQKERALYLACSNYG